MTKTFERKLPYPLFQENGDVMDSVAVFHRNGRLYIKPESDIDRLFISAGGTYWSRPALEEAIAELCYVLQEWKEAEELHGRVQPEEIVDDLELDEEPEEPEEEGPFEPAAGGLHERIERVQEELRRVVVPRDWVRNIPE